MTVSGSSPNDPAGLVLRLAGPGDLDTIVRFVRELADYEKLLDTVTATPEDIHHAHFGEHAFVETLLAETGGEPVGFALFFPVYSTFRGRAGLYIEDLFVLPGHRGRGVGRSLLSELARIAQRRGWDRLEWQVLDWNEPAIAFYRSLGARPREQWQTFRLEGVALDELAS